MSNDLVLRTPRRVRGFRTQIFASIVFFAIAIALAVPGQFGIKVPIALSVTIIYGVTAFVVLTGAYHSGLALLPRWMALLFFLPLAPLLLNIVSADPDYGSRMAMVAPLVADEGVVALVGLIGAVGTCALAGGFCLSNAWKKDPNSMLPSGRQRLMSSQLYGFIVLGSAALIAVSLPTTTIFNESYAEVTSGAARPLLDVQFSGVGFLVYVVLLAALLDAQREINARRRPIKIAIWVMAFGAIIVVNLLRGSRNPVGLAVAVLVLALQAAWRRRRLSVRRVGLIAIAGAGAAFILVEIEYFRAHIADGTYVLFEGVRRWSFTNQTWMGATYSLFGLTDSVLSQSFPLLHGETYLDYLRSLPPSIVANAIGYSRPITDFSNPSWWFQGYTVGGLHPTVVPFANFGIWGVVFVMGLTGWIIGRVELFADDLDFRRQLYYGSAFIGSLYWFWYGDMYAIRAFMGAFFVGFCWKAIARLPAKPDAVDNRMVRKRQLVRSETAGES